MRLRTMDELPLDGKRALVRVDFNVAVGKDGQIDSTEDYRLEAALPTIRELQQRRCRIILLTHVTYDADMVAVRRRLEELLHESIRTTQHFSGREVEAVVTSLEPGGMVLLPNVRGDSRELTGNERFAAELASIADVYINEAFSVSHRAHTSVAVVPRLLAACAGRRTVEEVTALMRVRLQPAHPYVALIGGAKIVDKIGMLRQLSEQVDTLCVGGQIANVFLTAQGVYAAEKFTSDEVAAAGSLLKANRSLVLPSDVVVGDADGQATHTITVDQLLQTDETIFDIGPQSVARIMEHCRGAQTILWNGPVGRFEVAAYGAGTLTLARQLAQVTAYKIVGGGDTVHALEQARVIRHFDHVSTGGGAMIAFLEGKRMPGLEPLYA